MAPMSRGRSDGGQKQQRLHSGTQQDDARTLLRNDALQGAVGPSYNHIVFDARDGPRCTSKAINRPASMLSSLSTCSSPISAASRHL